MQYTHERHRSYVVRHEGGELRITSEQLLLFLPELDDSCTP